MIALLALPPVMEGDVGELIFWAIVVGIYALSAVVGKFQKMAKKARQRTVRPGKRKEAPIEPARPAQPVRPVRSSRPAQSQRPAQPARPMAPAGGDLKSDLETILREQLGLDIPQQPKSTPRPARPMPASRPTGSDRPAVPARPSQPARPQRPAAPARQAVPRPAARMPAPAPVRAEAPVPVQPSTPPIREATVAKTSEDTYRLRETKVRRDRGYEARVKRVRAPLNLRTVQSALGRGGLSQAIVLTEILGPPRAERDFENR